MHEVAGLVGVEAHEVDVLPAPEEGEVDDRLGQLESSGGPGAALPEPFSSDLETADFL